MSEPDGKYKHPQRAQFLEWFRKLLYSCKSCQERDVLRNSKEVIYLSYLKEFGLEYGEKKDTLSSVDEE